MKTEMDINGKKLPIPSFFMISNLGGGGSDKYRETVYLDLYENIPTLYNYFYLRYPDFARKWLDKINNYETFADFISFVRKDMIDNEHYISKSHKPKAINYDKTVYLLDSGAANIVNKFVKEKRISYTKEDILTPLIDEMKNYYDFANRFKFDLIIGFDRGGKYTFKGDERFDEKIISMNEVIQEDSANINFIFLEETIKYLLKHKDYYPKVLATVHGNTPADYKRYAESILNLENKYNFKFWGFALGGIASSKGKDAAWFTSDSPAKIHNQVLVTYATKIVKSVVGDRPIHVLGGGGYKNIIPLYFSGATSYDTQTPGRRAYDGGKEGVKHLYDPDFDGSKDSALSKYLVGRLNSYYETINNNIEYKYHHLNKLTNIELCSCSACLEVNDFGDIKEYYSHKDWDSADGNEDYYYARQLCNSHGIWQHVRLSQLLCGKDKFSDVEQLFNSKDAFIQDVRKVLNTRYNIQ